MPDSAAPTTPEIPAEQHEALVLAAQAGDMSASERLFVSVSGYLRSLVYRYTVTDADQEEAFAVASLAFAEAVREYAPGGRFIGILRARVIRDLTDAGSGSAFAVRVPGRTLRRFFSILKKADGDLEAGAALAPAYHMDRHTFVEIAAAVHDAAEMPDAAFAGPSTSDVVEEALLLDVAWAAVDDFETDVCRLAYGFSDYTPNSDGEIAEKLGYSRPKVQRTRTGALDKMREALGLDA
jgi:DNA-directed RNA polymerase specialized sigma24 family protein